MKRSFHTSFGPTAQCRQQEAKDGVDNNSSFFTFTEILVLERMVRRRASNLCLETKCELSSPQPTRPFTTRAGALPCFVSVLETRAFAQMTMETTVVIWLARVGEWELRRCQLCPVFM
jgi:hypothetical protein